MKTDLDYELTILALEKYITFQTDLAKIWVELSPETYNDLIAPVELVADILEAFANDHNSRDLVEAIHELGEDNTELVIHFLNQEGLMESLIKIELEIFKDILDEDGELPE